jgi:hypothetical protein
MPGDDRELFVDETDAVESMRDDVEDDGVDGGDVMVSPSAAAGEASITRLGIGSDDVGASAGVKGAGVVSFSLARGAGDTGA